jgi:2-octaprenyl-6-methoxyphenol hydroxylase
MSLEIAGAAGNVTVEASLVVLADGGKSPICSQLGIERKVEQYKQHALIANIAFERPHCNIAYERFTDTGPIAVLPLQSMDNQNRGSLVWTLTEQQVGTVMAMDEAELLTTLQERFGARLGELLNIGEKFCYPLSLSVAKEQIRPGLVLLGNVAHTLHPVAGQGLNLALRDTEVLVDCLRQAHVANHCLGKMDVLQSYVDRQQFDQDKVIAFSDSISRLFSSNNNAKVWARKIGLLSIELVPTLKRGFAEQAMGLDSS